MKVRFAPSPTGYIHVGNCRTVLINWLFARHHGGIFLLRIDDTDQERSEKRYEEAILEDLAWLGLNFDEFQRQSDRLARYDEVKKELIAAGRLYPCYETAEELEFKRKRQMARGLPPLYDREALALTDAQRQEFEAQGRRPHWRFRIDTEDVNWDDMVRGPIHFEASKLSDPVLFREDGLPIYTLASVVDDKDMGITHIIRGEDHIGNTAVQVQVLRALGVVDGTIAFGHLSLLQSADGEELSKRLGTGSIRDLKENGILPMGINSLLAKMGTSDPIAPYHSLKELVESFDIKKFSRGTPKFSEVELRNINEKLIHTLPYDQAQAHTHLTLMDEDFWKAVRSNLKSLNDLPEWWMICRGQIKTKVDENDKAFIQEALNTFSPSWDQWITDLKSTTERRGKELFMPLRQALTGQSHGPELKTILDLMGPTLAKERLTSALS